MTVLVYRYRVNPAGGAADRRAVLNQPQLTDQFRMAHDLRNAMVAIEHDHAAALTALWSTHGDIADTEAQLAAAEAAAEATATAIRATRAQTRKAVTDATAAAELRASRAKVRELRASRRASITEAYLTAKPRIEELREIRNARTKALYAEFCQTGRPSTWCHTCRTAADDSTCPTCGPLPPRTLYWATFNAVGDSHRAACGLISTARKQRRPAQLRFHRWEGSGRIAVQLQRGATDPPRTPHMLSDPNGKWKNVLLLPPVVTRTDWDTLTRAEQRALGRATISWNLGSERIKLPVQFHRPLPPDCEIVSAELIRATVATTPEMHLCITVRVPDPEPATGHVVAVHVGWRSRPDGSVRVAAWRSTRRITVPEHLAEHVTVHDTGHSGEIIAPARWITAADETAGLTSIRALAFGAIRDKAADWLAEHPTDAEVTAADIRAWRSPNRLAALTIRWRATPPPGGAEIAALLEAWRKQDKHLWQWEAHGRRKHTRRRDDGWRRAAAWLATGAGAILVDDTDLNELRRHPDLIDPDPAFPEAAAAKARAKAVCAAPGNLRHAVTCAAKRRGVAVTTIPAQYLSRRHVTCDQIADDKALYARSSTVTCPGCGDAYDQDHNATTLMIRAYTSIQAGNEPATR